MEQIKSFNTLIAKHIITIPKIQRDYVQGSKKHAEKRDKFIESLIKHLNSKKPLHLDFIYGSCNENAKNDFSPLDGQQRLTTLFLLHWILEVQTGRKSEYKTCVLSYQSRRSSELFCDKLNTDTFDSQFNDKSVSNYIKEEKIWYVSEWDFDPTICAMLEMLDALQNNFKLYSKEQLDEMLNNFEVISFDILDLKDYHLTDTLYIKMNERGKQLTEFENWKALFITFLEKNHKDDYLKRFEHSIEHEWTDMLWTYALRNWEELSDKDKENKPYPVIDNDFMNLLSFIHETYFFALNPKINGMDVQTSDFHNTLTSMEIIFAKKDNIKFLFEFFDVWQKISKESTIDIFFENLIGEKGITLWDNNKQSNLFVECIEKGLNMGVKLKVLFYAISKYCISKECYSITEELKLFVRICRNLIESIYQFNRGTVACNTDIRLTEWSKYKRAIDKIVDNIVYGKRWFDNVNDKDFGDVEHEKYKKENQNRNFVERWEDFDMFRGCLKAVLPALNGNSPENVDDALTAFENASKKDINNTDTEKVQLLIAFDYDGYYGDDIGYCAYGARCFFGKDGKWDVIFRRDWEKLKEPFSKYVSAFKGCSDVNKLINCAETSSSWNSFKYYMLKYPDFVQGNEGTHYLAVKGEYDDLDMINIEFSTNPLLKYHCDPFTYVICKRLNNFEQVKCWSRYGDKSSVYLHYTPNDQSECFIELRNYKDGWVIYKTDERNKEHLTSLYSELTEKGIKLDDYKNGGKIIHIVKDQKDLIETGVEVAKVCLDWINNTFNKK